MSALFHMNRSKPIRMKSRTIQKCQQIKISATKMNSTNRISHRGLTIHRNVIFRRQQKPVFTQMNRIIKRKTFFRRIRWPNRMGPIKPISIEKKWTKRKIMCMERPDRHHRQSIQQHHYMNAIRATLEMCIIHRAAFPSIRQMQICHRISRAQSKPICTKKK